MTYLRPIPEQIASDAEIRNLVIDFYGRARRDAELGPLFENNVKDWDAHFDKLTDFWSSVLNTSGRYKGQPMPAHVRLDELQMEHFGRWLSLFRLSAAATLNADAAAVAIIKAERIAESLQLGIRHFRGQSLLQD